MQEFTFHGLGICISAGRRGRLAVRPPCLIGVASAKLSGKDWLARVMHFFPLSSADKAASPASPAQEGKGLKRHHLVGRE